LTVTVFPYNEKVRDFVCSRNKFLTVPLMEGTDGVEKMSKSYNNHVGLTDSPDEMYFLTGKLWFSWT